MGDCDANSFIATHYYSLFFDPSRRASK
ncbi:uncharacterized protein G2W53_006931 [Senna tora]|uniref:Uncharacterized protein n=1 Tax=Senna tora TaxID=362788 RepID=A0A834X5I7_9FABA|nr:uncharacterized protein G2W53_006931 [Senna tora]